MKTTILTLAAILAFVSISSAYPKYEYGQYAHVKPQARRVTTVAVFVNGQASSKAKVNHPIPFTKAGGFTRF